MFKAKPVVLIIGGFVFAFWGGGGLCGFWGWIVFVFFFFSEEFHDAGLLLQGGLFGMDGTTGCASPSPPLPVFRRADSCRILSLVLFASLLAPSAMLKCL